jgi:hypothetical protein
MISLPSFIYFKTLRAIKSALVKELELRNMH